MDIAVSASRTCGSMWQGVHDPVARLLADPQANSQPIGKNMNNHNINGLTGNGAAEATIGMIHKTNGVTGDGVAEATIGMSRRKFYDLVPVFAASHEATSHHATKPDQSVNNGAMGNRLGASARQLDTAEKRLFFILYYLKTNPTFDALGFNFDLSPSHAYDHMILYARILRRSLENLAVTPQKTMDSFERFRLAIEEYSARHTRSASAGNRLPAVRV
jgi:hypothetical protein